jgi:hypothetical protein
LAVDTGAVYIGNGTEWNYLGDIVPEKTGGTSSFIAAPGDVSNALEAAAEGDGGMVALDPNKRYPQPPDPWQVKPGVVLDCNGATIVGTGDQHDTDFIHLHPTGQVYRPRVDLYDGGNGYSANDPYQGNVFTLDTRYGYYFADGTTIQNGSIAGVGDGGTAIYLYASTEGRAITHVDLNVNIGLPRDGDADNSIGTGLHIDTTGDDNSLNDGYINGVYVSGHWRYPRVGFLQEGVRGDFNQQNWNRFQVQLQAGDGGGTAWRILDPTFSKHNMWQGFLWDEGGYNGPWWEILSTYDGDASWKGCRDNMVIFPVKSSNGVLNESNYNHHISWLMNMSHRTV